MNAQLKAVPTAEFRELVLSLDGKLPAKMLGRPGEPKFRNPTLCEPSKKFELIGENMFDEIHAYHIFQKLIHQGDDVEFFRFFTACWAWLKPDGILVATVPSPKSDWLWGDPGNRCSITLQSITFLEQPQYDKQVNVTAMTDYRSIYQADFDPLLLNDDSRELRVILRAVKPSRCTQVMP